MKLMQNAEVIQSISMIISSKAVNVQYLNWIWNLSSSSKQKTIKKTVQDPTHNHKFYLNML